MVDVDIDEPMLSGLLASAYDQQLGVLAPHRVAAVLNADLNEVARIAHVTRRTLSRDPGSPKIQGRLGEVLHILMAAADLIGGDASRAALWFRHQPLSGFDGQTAEELVTAGHAAAVLAHLKMLRDGVFA